MSFANAGLTVKETTPTPLKAVSGTVAGSACTKAEILQTPLQSPAVNVLLNNLSSMQQSHKADKKTFFKQGLPFYTCINALDKLWQKEMPDGSLYEVYLTFDWEKDQPAEKLLKKIR
jgi:hypothetical protein